MVTRIKYELNFFLQIVLKIKYELNLNIRPTFWTSNASCSFYPNWFRHMLCRRNFGARHNVKICSSYMYVNYAISNVKCKLLLYIIMCCYKYIYESKLHIIDWRENIILVAHGMMKETLYVTTKAFLNTLCILLMLWAHLGFCLHVNMESSFVNSCFLTLSLKACKSILAFSKLW